MFILMVRSVDERVGLPILLLLSFILHNCSYTLFPLRTDGDDPHNELASETFCETV